MAEDAKTRESADADKVDEAIRAIHAGALNHATRLLREVVANAPAAGQYAVQEDGPDGVVVRFWTMTDFLHFVLWDKQTGVERGVVWAKCAYPRAWYYLGFIAVKEKRFREAVDLLANGLALEPEAAMLIIESARAYAGLNQYQTAIEWYRRVRTIGPFVSAQHVAFSLRGEGVQLIDLGELDQAEALFRESLALDPESPVAQNELRYIARLRAGGPKVPTQVVATNVDVEKKCVVCGEINMKEGTVSEIDGRIRFVCKRCGKRDTTAAAVGPRKPAKKWWQFWK